MALRERLREVEVEELESLTDLEFNTLVIIASANPTRTPGNRFIARKLGIKRNEAGRIRESLTKKLSLPYGT